MVVLLLLVKPVHCIDTLSETFHNYRRSYLDNEYVVGFKVAVDDSFGVQRIQRR